MDSIALTDLSTAPYLPSREPTKWAAPHSPQLERQQKRALEQQSDGVVPVRALVAWRVVPSVADAYDAAVPVPVHSDDLDSGMGTVTSSLPGLSGF